MARKDHDGRQYVHHITQTAGANAELHIGHCINIQSLEKCAACENSPFINEISEQLQALSLADQRRVAAAVRRIIRGLAHRRLANT